MSKKYIYKTIINRKICICKNKLNKNINFGNLPLINNYTSYYYDWERSGKSYYSHP